MPARGYSYRSSLQRSTRRLSRGGRWRKALAMALVIVAGGALLFGWRVQTVEVAGASLTPSGAIRDAVLVELQRHSWTGFILQNRMLLLRPQRIATGLKEQFRLSDAVVRRRLNGTLRVMVTEQTIAAISAPINGVAYLIGEQGRLVGPAPEAMLAEKKPETIIIQASIVNPIAGEPALTPEAIVVVRGAWTALTRMDGSLRPSYAAARPESPSTVDIVTASGATIALTTLEPLALQLDKLQALLSNRPNEVDRAKIRSIDLRYGDRVYVQ